MEVVLSTGFSQIVNDFHFEKETQKKGKALVTAEHVINVKEYQLDGPSLINSHVIRQTSVTATLYNGKTIEYSIGRILFVISTANHTTHFSSTFFYFFIHNFNHDFTQV